MKHFLVTCCAALIASFLLSGCPKSGEFQSSRLVSLDSRHAEFLWGNPEGAWNPSPEQVGRAVDLAERFLYDPQRIADSKKLADKWTNSTQGARMRRRYDESYIQSVGVALQGRPLVLLDIFCNRPGGLWETDPVPILSTSECTWAAAVDVSLDKVVLIELDGFDSEE